MKTFNILASVFALALTVGVTAPEAMAAKKKMNLKQDFATLGDNQDVVERAQALNAEKKVQVVQNRIVDRNLRLELGVAYGLVGGGDSYVRTTNLGGHVDFHISPKFSFGVRYLRSYNGLTKEGEEMYDRAQAAYEKDPNSQYRVAQIDTPIEQGLVVVNWYPFYGKLNLFDLGVAHFDVYALAGYGKMTLQSGMSDTYAGGAGMGFWWTQYFNSRAELTYQSYTDMIGTYNRSQGAIQGMFSLGVML